MDNDRLQALLTWFRHGGGRLGAVRVLSQDGRLSMRALRALDAGEVVLSAPRRVLLTMDCARHSTIGARLLGADITRHHSVMAAFLVEAARAGGPWRPFVDAIAQTFADRPVSWPRADWALLRGSDAQRLSTESWNDMRAEWQRVDAALPHAVRIPLKDFAWGWRVSATHAFSIATERSTQNAIAPFGESLGPSLSPSCKFRCTPDGPFEIITNQAVAAGEALSIHYGAMSDAGLLARYGLCLGADNPNDTARIAIPLGESHWLHAAVPELTHGAAAPAFDLDANMGSAQAWRLWSLLRLSALPGPQALQDHPELRSARMHRVPALDLDNERAAVEALQKAVDAALAAFDGGSSEDDERLIAEATADRRRRLALHVRRTEKRILERWKATADDAHRLLYRTCDERRQALQRRSRDEHAPAGPRPYHQHLLERLSFMRRVGPTPPPLTAEEMENTLLSTSEKALAAWFRHEGGRINGAALAVRNGLRGLVATRDIRKGDVVMSVPRHLYLTADSASHTALGLRIREAFVPGNHALIGLDMIHARRVGSFWAPMVNATPTSFEGRPETWSREDWTLLDGSSAQRMARGYWRHTVRQFKSVRRVLTGAERVSLREFRWGYMASATRTFQLILDGQKSVGMVPMAEMFNHSPSPNCYWGGEHGRQFAITAKQDIPIGTELTITYGRVSNSRLLAQYGFALEENPSDAAVLNIALGPDHWLQKFAHVLTDGANTPWMEIGRKPTDDSTKKTLSLLRLATLPDADAARAHPQVKSDALTEVPVLDIASERAALLRLVEACERSLAAFPCGVDRDDELLASGTLDWRQTFAVKVRRGEKHILSQTLTQARSAVVALYLPPDESRAALERRAAEAGDWQPYFQDLRDRLLQPVPATAS